jgi:hypothetical protein
LFVCLSFSLSYFTFRKKRSERSVDDSGSQNFFVLSSHFCLSVCLSVCQSVCLSVCLSFFLSILSVCL